ncbi:MAG: P1 family peptidase [Actinobacteria bacterium]|nr:P1 family peptidase [Actinomycetota bacterium]
MSASITDVPGVRVGSWTGNASGVTVVLPPEGTVGSVEVRGGAPATRETALLDPTKLVARVDAIVLTGGSAFGLAAADGVMTFLSERGLGFPTGGGPVPIVPSAAIFDLVASGGERPSAQHAYEAASAAERDEPVRNGRFGAGRGATIGKWHGPDHAVPGGMGTASLRESDAVVGALAVVNAVGDVVAEDGRVLAGSSAPAGAPSFPSPALGTLEHTTLVVVATDAGLTKAECLLLAQSAHHGIARAVRPSHTRFDGDVAFALATGRIEGHVDRVRIAATDVVAEAVRAAVTRAG